MRRRLFVYDEKKIREYSKLSAEQKLEWLWYMANFLHCAMPEKAKKTAHELKYKKA